MEELEAVKEITEQNIAKWRSQDTGGADGKTLTRTLTVCRGIFLAPTWWIFSSHVLKKHKNWSFYANPCQHLKWRYSWCHDDWHLIMTPRVFGIDLPSTTVRHWMTPSHLGTVKPSWCHNQKEIDMLSYSYRHFLILRGNGPHSLCDVLPFEINIENICLFISFICTIFDKFLRNSVGWRVREQSVGSGFEPCTGFIFYLLL